MENTLVRHFDQAQRRSLRKWKGARCPTTYRAEETLSRYRFEPIGILTSPFSISFTNVDAKSWTRSIYAFVINNEIVRIGSSKGPLSKRMKIWEKDVVSALNGNYGATKKDECDIWAAELADFKQGIIWAREGTKFVTPISDTPISAYQDEESELIARHMPRLNRGQHR